MTDRLTKYRGQILAHSAPTQLSLLQWEEQQFSLQTSINYCNFSVLVIQRHLILSWCLQLLLRASWIFQFCCLVKNLNTCWYFSCVYSQVLPCTQWKAERPEEQQMKQDHRKTGKWKLAAASSPPTLTTWELVPVIPNTCTCICMIVVPLMNRNVCLAHVKRHQLLLASKSRCLVLAFFLSETPDGSGLNPTGTDQEHLANFSVDHVELREMSKVDINGSKTFVKVSLFSFLRKIPICWELLTVSNRRAQMHICQTEDTG